MFDMAEDNVLFKRYSDEYISMVPQAFVKRVYSLFLFVFRCLLTCLSYNLACCLFLVWEQAQSAAQYFLTTFLQFLQLRKMSSPAWMSCLYCSWLFFVLCQCSVCLFSLVVDWRSDYLYLFFFILMYFSLAMIFCIVVTLSFSRVFIIHSVSIQLRKMKGEGFFSFLKQSASVTQLYFQPATFHNLNHEMVFQIVVALQSLVALTSMVIMGVYDFNTNIGKLKTIFDGPTVSCPCIKIFKEFFFFFCNY